MQDLIKYGNILNKNKKLSKEQLQLIKDYIKYASMDEIGYIYGVSEHAIRNRINKIIKEGKVLTK
jgi:predicted DNA-binding protein YlxM (UPF0122 family)